MHRSLQEESVSRFLETGKEKKEMSLVMLKLQPALGGASSVQISTSFQAFCCLIKLLMMKVRTSPSN